MSKSQESNIAVSFFNIHRIITRSLRVSLESVQGVLQQGFQGDGNREGFFNFIRALTSVLNAHHLTEDEIAFPYFRDKLPDAPFDTLTYYHHVMVLILDEINLAVDKSNNKGQLEIELRNIENALARLNEEWPYHIQPETDEFINKADALIPVEEQLRLVRLFAEHGLKNAVPHYLTVPFMLYNLPVEDRKVFSEGMPAEVIQNLVPVVWKEKWMSMTPFLLA
ncbi:MAG: hemerythrin domain-containing protein [Anaerolineales bacterium]